MMAYKLQGSARLPYVYMSERAEFYGLGLRMRVGAVQVPRGKGPSGSGYEFIAVEFSRGGDTRVQFFVHFPRRSYSVFKDSAVVPVSPVYFGGGGTSYELSQVRSALQDLAMTVSSNKRAIERLFTTVADLSTRVNMIERALKDLLEERGETSD